LPDGLAGVEDVRRDNEVPLLASHTPTLGSIEQLRMFVL
jgi:hypothetical protein